MADEPFDPDKFTKLAQFTKTYHRDVYPAIESKGGASGKVVLITGASRGLGKGLATAWGRAGAAGVIVTSRKAEDLQSVVNTINSLSPKTEVLPVAVDVKQDKLVEQLFLDVKAKFGRLDVVIANAGVMAQVTYGFSKIGEMDPDGWWNDVETNTRGTYLTAHHFVRTFGGAGTFISITSSAAAVTLPGLSSYSISKLDCLRLTEHLDLEYPELRAFALDPGIVKGTTTMDAFSPFAFDTPELAGAMTIWLSGPRSDGVKGGYVSTSWDVDELEQHGEEIRSEGLLKTKFLGGLLGKPYEFKK